MIGNDHVRFGRGPSGKGLAAASNSPDGLPHLHPSRHATPNTPDHIGPPTQGRSLNVTASRPPQTAAKPHIYLALVVDPSSRAN